MEGLAARRQLHTPRRAVEQPRAKPGLERIDAVADQRRRHARMPARLNHSREKLHVLEHSHSDASWSCDLQFQFESIDKKLRLRNAQVSLMLPAWREC
jgi:hypothetical protein